LQERQFLLRGIERGLSNADGFGSAAAEHQIEFGHLRG
jgi:hypothetical protein